MDDSSQPLPSPDALDGWDAVAAERERLADERERLADEREALADEREYLADEHERLLDDRNAARQRAREGDDADDDETVRLEARSSLERAEAHVERALAERERARNRLGRAERAESRAEAGVEHDARLEGVDTLADDERVWADERRAFVASERERLSNLRDRADDQRDELADQRERRADRRDAAETKRSADLDRRDGRARRGSRPGSSGSPAGADLVEVRDAAQRQRQHAARARDRERADRADARTHGTSPIWSSEFYGPGLAAQFALLTRELFASRDLAHTIERVQTFALDALPGCVASGVTILGNAVPTLHITSDAVAQRLDELQFELGHGPAVDAVDGGVPVGAADLAQDHRWAGLAAAARDLGICSTLAYGLSVPREDHWQPLGVFTLYAEEPAGFDGEASELGDLLATYLAVAAGFDRDRTDLARREAALHRALGTRDVIGQAKGILMERRHLRAGEAFDILRRTSQRLNVRLNQVAEQLAETGALPDEAQE
jgi:hypothetical protein